MEKVIIIFNEDMLTDAFINKKLDINFLGDENPNLRATLVEISEKPKIKVENRTGGEFFIGLKVIDKNDPRFLEAITQELNNRFFIAALTSERLIPMFTNLNKKDLSYLEREEIVGALINLSEEDQLELLNDIDKVKTILSNDGNS